MSFQDWIELESDPGLFTLLVYDFGVKNVCVEEVYDLSKPFDRVVYGFIFLFKWTEERKSRRKAANTEETTVYNEEMENEMFFAQQIIPNSCASHALLSVLLNIPDITLGYTLTQLRDSCKGYDSETKGYAIGNFWNIAVAHNNHGRRELRWQSDRLKNVTATRSMEAFHYVSYIPYRGRLFELDGLKPRPIDHGPWLPDETWSGKARRVIQERIQVATGGELSHDIRYNLLAVVPEQRQMHKQKCEVLAHNKKVLIELFKRLAMKESFISGTDAPSILKNTDIFSHNGVSTSHSKKVSFGERPNSPQSSCSSTLTGLESPSHLFSDSEDSSVETYRIKSVLRGEMKGPVYVYGSSAQTSNDVKTEEGQADASSSDESTKRKSTSIKEENMSGDNKRYKLSGDFNLNQSKGLHEMTSDDLSNMNLGKERDLNETLPYDNSYGMTGNVKHKHDQNQFSLTNDIKQEIKIKVEPGSSEQPYPSGSVIGSSGGDKSFILESAKDVHWNVNRDYCIEENIEQLKYLEDHQNEGMVKKEVEFEAIGERPGLGVEIIADDADIDSVLEQNQVKKLSLEELLKYEDKIKLHDLQKCMQDLDEMFKTCQSAYKEEVEKIERYKIEDCRRRHNYDPFVSTFLTMLAEQGHLARLLEEQNTVIRRVSSTSSLKGNGNKKDITKKKKKIRKGVIKK